MENPYIKRLVRSAWEVTMSDLGLDNPKRLLLKAIGAVALAFVLFDVGLDNLVDDLIGERWGRLVVLILIFPALFLVNLILTPAKLQKDSDNKIRALEADIKAQRARYNPEHVQQLQSLFAAGSNNFIRTDARGVRLNPEARKHQDNWYAVTHHWLSHNLPEYLPLFQNARPPGALEGPNVWVHSKLDALTQIITEYERRRP